MLADDTLAALSWAGRLDLWNKFYRTALRRLVPCPALICLAPSKSPPLAAGFDPKSKSKLDPGRETDEMARARCCCVAFDFPIQSMRLQRFTGETWELFGDTIGGDW